jgi:hypothetical protein
MKPPCKDCITYILCKSRFECALGKYHSMIDGVSDRRIGVHSIWFAYNDIIRFVNCDKAELYVASVLNGVDTELESKQEEVVNDILKVFDDIS